jgi:branched-chain amino acid transport system permease protein
MALLRSPAFLFKLVFVVILLVWPLILQNTYDMSVMTTAGFFAIMVIAVSLILGQAGQLSLGHNAFYGIGA